jgi:hypothetical protein
MLCHILYNLALFFLGGEWIRSQRISKSANSLEKQCIIIIIIIIIITIIIITNIVNDACN